MSEWPSLPVLVYGAAVFLLAGWIKGVVGMGLPIVSMAALSLVMPPVQAAVWVSMPSLLTNTWQALAGPALKPLTRRLAPLLLMAVLGIVLAVPLLTAGESPVSNLLLGLVLLLYAMVAMFLPPFLVSVQRQRWAGPVIGGLTGVLAGATGLNAVPLVPYLNSLGLSKDELVQALGLCFVLSTLALSVALALHGQFPAGMALVSLLAALPALLGMRLGQVTRGRFSPVAFRRWFLLALVGIGLYTCVRAAAKLI